MKPVLILFLLLMLVQCAATEPAPQATVTHPVTVINVATQSALPPPPPTAVPNPTVEFVHVAPRPGVPNATVMMENLVCQDLARRTGIDVMDIAVLDTTPVTWEDSGLGCHTDNATMMDIDGFRIELMANNQTYTYHTNKSNTFYLCEIN